MCNKRKRVTRYIVAVACILYAVLLIYVLFIHNRGSVLKYVPFDEYILMTSNIIPFNTIKTYIVSISDGSMNINIPLRNLMVNTVLFIPYAFFVFYYKNITIKKFLIVLVTIVFCVEILQTILRVGMFDIDDVILNVAGSVSVYICLKKWLNSETARQVKAGSGGSAGTLNIWS